MTIQQWNRREELRKELSDLVVQMVQLGSTAEGQNTALFQRLDQQREEKTAELESLNTLYNDSGERLELKYHRLVQNHCGLLRLLSWLILLCLPMTFFMSMTLGPSGSPEHLFGLFTFVCNFLMAVWLFYVRVRYRPE